MYRTFFYVFISLLFIAFPELIVAQCSSLTNVAIQKVTSQSSGTDSDKAVDGIKGDNNNYSETTWSNQPWWEVDLGSGHTIDTVNVWGRDAMFNNYYVFISSSPFTSTDYNILLGDPNVTSSVLQTSQAGQPTSLNFSSITGRYIRVQMTGTGIMRVAELEVMGCESTGSGQQNQTITFDPISDKLTTDAPFAITASSSSTSGIPITFNILSGPATIMGNMISLNDGIGTVVVVANQAGNSNYFAAPPVTQNFDVNAPSSGEGCSSLTNVAIQKVTSQSSGTDSDKAVDGIKGDNNNYSETTWSNQPWWEVDLGSGHTIDTVNVWGRDAMFNNYYVFISSSPFTSTDYNILLGDPNVTSSVLQTSQAGQPTSLNFSSITGRYIRVQMTGTGIMRVAELEVMGCESTGSGQQNQTITFDPISDKLTTDAPFAITASSSSTSGIPITFNILSGPATISENMITLNGETGTVVVVANQAGNSNYSAAPPVTQNFDVNSSTSGGGCNGINNLVEGQGVTVAQSSTNLAASNAIDGNGTTISSTNWTGGGIRSWWQIDLVEEYNIETIKLWNGATDAQGASYFKNYYVFFSNTPFPTGESDPNDLINQGFENKFFAEQVSISTPTILDFVDKSARYVRIQLLDASFLRIAEIDIEGCIPSGGTPQPEQGIFTQLKKKLDGNYTLPINDKIYFTYPEDYAIVNGENNQVTYKIKNWKNQVVKLGTLSNQYGANWQSLALDTDSNASADYYILEIDGVSKDESYYLRFKHPLLLGNAPQLPGGGSGGN